MPSSALPIAICQFCVILLSRLNGIASERLFLIGDSVDRYIVQDYCNYQRSRGLNPREFNWGDTNIRYASIRGMMPSLICEVPSTGDSVAFVHIFGSAATGPYFHNFMSSSEDPYVDTKVRVAKSLSLYYAHIGRPDRVIFQTEKWDVQYIHDAFDSAPKYSELYNRSLAAFVNNTHARLNEIRDIIGNDVDLGLRTAVWGKVGSDVLSALNDIVRSIAAERNLTFYDYDKDVWSTVEFDHFMQPFVFRDHLHPKVYYTAPAGEKMLGRRYSQCMQFARNGSFYVNRFDQYFTTLDPTISILLIRGEGRPLDELFFYHHPTKKRYMVGSSFLKMLRLGPNDIKDIPTPTLQSIPIGPPIPTLMYEPGAVLNSTLRDHAYFVTHDLNRREIPCPEAVLALAASTDHVIHLDGTNDFWMDYIANPLGSDIPDLFSNGLLLKLRNGREIYIMDGGKKRLIPSMDIFAQLGKDLSEVKSVDKPADVDIFNLIPVGEPLQLHA